MADVTSQPDNEHPVARVPRSGEPVDFVTLDYAAHWLAGYYSEDEATIRARIERGQSLATIAFIYKLARAGNVEP